MGTTITEEEKRRLTKRKWNRGTFENCQQCSRFHQSFLEWVHWQDKNTLQHVFTSSPKNLNLLTKITRLIMHVER